MTTETTTTTTKVIIEIFTRLGLIRTCCLDAGNVPTLRQKYVEDEEKIVRVKKKEREKGRKQLLQRLVRLLSLSLSRRMRVINLPTDLRRSVLMTSVTHATIFRLCRSDTPTWQNQPI